MHLIEHGVTGFLVNPDAVRPYRESLMNLLSDPKLRKRIARQARESVMERTWARNNDKLLEHYRLAISDLKAKKE